MTRHIFLFLGTFVAGALVALAVRAAMFNPHHGRETHAGTAGDYAPMVNNALTPAKTEPSASAPSAAGQGGRNAGADAHAGHPSGAPAATGKPAAGTEKPVNTVCAICGMEVDPKVPTAQYQGKTIGFGCRMCPPKFKADPERWGPLYLKNEVAKRG